MKKRVFVVETNFYLIELDTDLSDEELKARMKEEFYVMPSIEKSQMSKRCDFNIEVVIDNDEKERRKR